MRPSTWIWMLALVYGCSSELDVEVVLTTPVRPDPFEGVRTVRLRALEAGRLTTIGEGRWDQGALDLPTLVSPLVERFVVEGLAEDGRVVSSGASAPLDLLTAPPDGAVQIMFSAVGVLSTLEAVGPVRRGARAVVRDDDTVLFVGGVDDRGCMHTQTEIYSSDSPHLVPGPPLVDGRTDFDLSSLPDGRILVTGGRSESTCGAPMPDTSVVYFDGRTSRPVEAPGFERSGAALAVMPSSEVIVAGGEGDLVARTDVVRFDPATSQFRPIGVLDGPRSFATAVAIAGSRVALLGGRSQRGVDTALDSATIFVPSRGAALEERIPLGLELVRPTVRRTLAGGIIYAGGRTSDGNGHAAVRMLVVRTERDFPLGDSTAVTSLSSTIADGALVDAGDGSYVLVDHLRANAEWIQLLPRRTRRLEGLASAAVGGGRLADGRVVIRTEDGIFHSFNPGIAGVVGPLVRDGVLGVDEGEANAGLSGGLVPLRPDAWRLTTRGLSVSGPPTLEGDVTPESRAIFVGIERTDFDVSFDIQLESDSRAALLFAQDLERFDHVVIGSRVSVHRPDVNLGCEPVDAPAFEDPALHRVRVRRAVDRIQVDVDGQAVLDCEAIPARRGRLGFGLVGGTATFENVSFGVP